MDTNRFERALTSAERLLEHIQDRVGTSDVPWYRQPAREGIARARAELAKMRDEIYWRDEDPF
jgi:uncharacterized protein (DUF2164 family)